MHICGTRVRWVNSLPPRICRCNLELVIFNLISGINIWSILCEITFRWRPDWWLVNNGSVNSYYLSLYYLDLHHYIALIGHNGLIYLCRDEMADSSRGHLLFIPKAWDFCPTVHPGWIFLRLVRPVARPSKTTTLGYRAPHGVQLLVIAWLWIVVTLFEDIHLVKGRGNL